MRKVRQPRGEFRPENLPAFFAAIGIDDNPFLTLGLEHQLEKIAAVFWQQFKVPTVGTHNKKLRQYLRASRKKRELRQALRLEQQIVEASFKRVNPDADMPNISADVAEYKFTLSDMENEEREHEADIEFLIKMGTSGYRQKIVTRAVVEPVVGLLLELGVKPSRTTMPISRIARTMRNLFGIAVADMVSDATVQKAWRREEAKRLAHQQSDN